jgi:hypothetical protein
MTYFKSNIVLYTCVSELNYLTKTKTSKSDTLVYLSQSAIITANYLSAFITETLECYYKCRQQFEKSMKVFSPLNKLGRKIHTKFFCILEDVHCRKTNMAASNGWGRQKPIRKQDNSTLKTNFGARYYGTKYLKSIYLVPL